MQQQKTILWDKVEGTRRLNQRERAYILDKISNASFYNDQFGDLGPNEEKSLIISIFGKIQAW